MKPRAYAKWCSALVVLGFASTASLSQAQIPTPQAYWSFDNEDPLTNQINDLTGNSNSGALFNGATYSTNVPAALGGGRSLIFSNPGNSTTNGDWAALDMSYLGVSALPSFTVSGWFRTGFSGGSTTEPQTGNWSILDFDRSDYFTVFVRGVDGRFGFSTSANNSIHDAAGVGAVNNNAWRHFAAVYDGTDKRIYIDGALNATSANAHGGQAVGNGTNTRFGILGEGSEAAAFNGARDNLFYDGQIDDLAVWHSALTPGQIAALASGAASPGQSIAALPQLPEGSHNVNFESLSAVVEGSLVANRIAGMTFEGAMLAQKGNATTFAFSASGGSDTPNSASNGTYFITDITNVSLTTPTNSPYNKIVANWNGAQVKDLTFEVMDIDATDRFLARIFDSVDGGNMLHEINFNVGDPGTGDGVATLIDFSAFSGIKRLEFELEQVGPGSSGFAADNFSFTIVAVPEPASIALWCLLGLGVAGPYYVKQRRKRSAA